MRHNTLYLQILDRPAALERILRVTRHRGFSVSRMHVAPSRIGHQMDIRLSVTGPRALNILFSQLKKLNDVTAISQDDCPAGDDES